MTTDTKTGGFRGPIQRIRYRLLVRQLMRIDGYPASFTLSFDGAGRNIRHAALVKSLGRRVRVEFYAPHDAYYEKSDREIAAFLAPQVAPQVGIKPPSDGWFPSERVMAGNPITEKRETNRAGRYRAENETKRNETKRNETIAD